MSQRVEWSVCGICGAEIVSTNDKWGHLGPVHVQATDDGHQAIKPS